MTEPKWVRRLSRLLTVDETSEVLTTRRAAVYAMTERTQLPGVVLIGRRLLVDANALGDWQHQKRAASLKEQAMTVRVRPYLRGGWEADNDVLLPEGLEHPERLNVSVTSKAAVTGWAEKRERELLVNGMPNDHEEAAPDQAGVSNQLAHVSDAMGDDAQRMLEKIAGSAADRHASISTLQTDPDKGEGRL